MNDPFAPQQNTEDPFDLGELGDLDSVEDNDFSPIPPGDYCLRLADLKVSKVKGGKHEGCSQWEWEIHVASGELKGRKLWHRTPLTKSLMWKVKQTVTAFGIWKEGEGQLKLSREASIGKICGGKVIVRTYKDASGNDKKVNDIERLSPWEGEPPPSDDIPF